MNKIISALFAIAILTLALPAMAQSPQAVTLLNGGTNNCAALATNDYTGQTLLIDATWRANVGISISYVGNSTTNNNGVVFVFDQSLDASTWSSTNKLRYRLDGNGTSTVSLVTNQPLGAVGWLRLNSIENSSSNAFTNITIKANLKPEFR